MPTRAYRPIEVPRNSAIAFITAFFAVFITSPQTPAPPLSSWRFALIWHIWWLAILGLLGVFATLLVFAFRNEEELEISAEQIARFERHARTEVA